MNIKWENLFFLPFMPAYWTAKNPWAGILIGVLFIILSFYLLRKADRSKLTFPIIVGGIWILLGIYEYSIWEPSREYWELVLTIPVVYVPTLIAIIKIIIARKSLNSSY